MREAVSEDASDAPLGAFVDRDHRASFLHSGSLGPGFRLRSDNGRVADLELGQTAGGRVLRYAHVALLDGMATVPDAWPRSWTGTDRSSRRPCSHATVPVTPASRGMFRTAVHVVNFVTPLFKVPARVTLSSPAGRFNWLATKHRWRRELVPPGLSRDVGDGGDAVQGHGRGIDVLHLEAGCPDDATRMRSRCRYR